jgi:hypothetical protein
MTIFTTALRKRQKLVLRTLPLDVQSYADIATPLPVKVTQSGRILNAEKGAIGRR